METITRSRGILNLILVFLIILTSCKKDEQPEPLPDLEIFNIVWNDFDRTYPYFIHKNIDWDSVQDVYSKKINENISNRDFFKIIGEMTLILKDIHVYVKSSYGTIQYSKKENYPENPPDLAIDYLDQVSINDSKGIFGKIANKNYSYIRIKTFVGDESDYSALYYNLGSIKDNDGLIMDIRSNGGGNDMNGRYLAGRFVAHDTPFMISRIRNGDNWNDFTPWTESFLPSQGYLNYQKPVILLTNRRVYSSAELFVLMMQTYPHLVIVGDTSGAASANPVLRKLSNGWQYRISTWQDAGMDHVLIEDNGIPPDYYILMTENSIAQGKDLILEKAIELLDNLKTSNRETGKSLPIYTQQ